MTPRPLTNKEIKFVLDSLPHFPDSIPYVPGKIREEIQKRLFLVLKDDNLKIEEDKIFELIKIQNEAFTRAIFTPGRPIGIITAEAIIGPVTQATLNAFHHTGTDKGAVNGVQSIGELTAATQNRKRPQAEVHFINKNLTYDEIYALQSKLLGVTLFSLLLHGEYKSVEREFSPDEDVKGEPINDWWYKYYLSINNEFVNPSLRNDNFYRLHFNVDKLYEFNITTTDICNKLMIDPEFNNGCWCIASPTHFGIVDVFADSDNLSSLQKVTNILNIVSDNNSISDIFFGKILVPSLKFINIKGIAHNENLVPRSHKTLDLILRTEKTGVDSFYIIRINEGVRRIKMIPKEKLISLLEECGIEVYFNGNTLLPLPKELEEEIEDDMSLHSSLIVKSIEGSPDTVVIDKLKEMNKEDEITKKPSYDKSSPPNLIKYSQYFYAVVEGSEKVNLEELLALDIVDEKRTFSNEYEDMNRIFGIEVPRNAMIREYSLLLSDPYINPAYIINEVNIQTSPGFITAVSASGAARQNTTTLQRASFQEATNIFIKAAIFGKKDSVKDTSSSIFLGKRIALGTGSVNVISDFNKKMQLVGEQNIAELINNDNFNIDDIPRGQTLGYGDNKVMYTEFGSEEELGGMPNWHLPPVPHRKKGPIPEFIKRIITFNVMNEVKKVLYSIKTPLTPMEFLELMQK